MVRVLLPAGATMELRKIALLTGDDLETLHEYLKVLDPEDPAPVYAVGFYVDGGLKLKINGGVWTAPLGREDRRY